MTKPSSCFLMFGLMLLAGNSYAGILSIDFDNATAGIQNSVTINSGGTVSGSIIFEGDGTAASQFDNFAVGLSHAGLTLLGYQAGAVAGDTVAAFDGFTASPPVGIGGSLSLDPILNTSVAMFSQDGSGNLAAFSPGLGLFYGTVQLLTFQLTGSSSSTVTLNVSFDDVLTSMSLFDPLNLTTTDLVNDLNGGSVTIRADNNVIPEPASLAVWSLASVAGIYFLRRRRI